MSPVVKQIKEPLGLHARMAIVQGKVTALTTTAVNAGAYSYDYISEGALMAMLRPLLAEQGIATYFSVEDVQRSGNLVSVKMSLTFVYGDERHTVYGWGDGTDRADKALAKAQTLCTRYVLWKCFMVPAADPVETENVERVHEVTKPVYAKAAPRSLGEWALDLELDEETVNRIIRFDSEGARSDMSEVEGTAEVNHIIGQMRAYKADQRAAETLMRRWEREQANVKADEQAVPS